MLAENIEPLVLAHRSGIVIPDKKYLEYAADLKTECERTFSLDRKDVVNVLSAVESLPMELDNRLYTSVVIDYDQATLYVKYQPMSTLTKITVERLTISGVSMETRYVPASSTLYSPLSPEVLPVYICRMNTSRQYVFHQINRLSYADIDPSDDEDDYGSVLTEEVSDYDSGIEFKAPSVRALLTLIAQYIGHTGEIVKYRELACALRFDLIFLDVGDEKLNHRMHHFPHSIARVTVYRDGTEYVGKYLVIKYVTEKPLAECCGRNACISLMNFEEFANKKGKIVDLSLTVGEFKLGENDVLIEVGRESGRLHADELTRHELADVFQMTEITTVPLCDLLTSSGKRIFLRIDGKDMRLTDPEVEATGPLSGVLERCDTFEKIIRRTRNYIDDFPGPMQEFEIDSLNAQTLSMARHDLLVAMIRAWQGLPIISSDNAMYGHLIEHRDVLGLGYKGLAEAIAYVSDLYSRPVERLTDSQKKLLRQTPDIALFHQGYLMLVDVTVSGISLEKVTLGKETKYRELSGTLSQFLRCDARGLAISQNPTPHSIQAAFIRVFGVSFPNAPWVEMSELINRFTELMAVYGKSVLNSRGPGLKNKVINNRMQLHRLGQHSDRLFSRVEEILLQSRVELPSKVSEGEALEMASSLYYEKASKKMPSLDQTYYTRKSAQLRVAANRVEGAIPDAELSRDFVLNVHEDFDYNILGFSNDTDQIDFFYRTLKDVMEGEEEGWMRFFPVMHFLQSMKSCSKAREKLRNKRLPLYRGDRKSSIRYECGMTKSDAKARRSMTSSIKAAKLQLHVRVKHALKRGLEGDTDRISAVLDDCRLFNEGNASDVLSVIGRNNDYFRQCLTELAGDLSSESGMDVPENVQAVCMHLRTYGTKTNAVDQLRDMTFVSTDFKPEVELETTSAYLSGEKATLTMEDVPDKMPGLIDIGKASVRSLDLIVRSQIFGDYRPEECIEGGYDRLYTRVSQAEERLTGLRPGCLRRRLVTYLAESQRAFCNVANAVKRKAVYCVPFTRNSLLLLTTKNCIKANHLKYVMQQVTITRRPDMSLNGGGTQFMMQGYCIVIDKPFTISRHQVSAIALSRNPVVTAIAHNNYIVAASKGRASEKTRLMHLLDMITVSIMHKQDFTVGAILNDMSTGPQFSESLGCNNEALIKKEFALHTSTVSAILGKMLFDLRCRVAQRPNKGTIVAGAVGPAPGAQDMSVAHPLNDKVQLGSYLDLLDTVVSWKSLLIKNVTNPILAKLDVTMPMINAEVHRTAELLVRQAAGDMRASSVDRADISTFLATENQEYVTDFLPLFSVLVAQDWERAYLNNRDDFYQRCLSNIDLTAPANSLMKPTQGTDTQYSYTDIGGVAVPEVDFSRTTKQKKPLIAVTNDSLKNTIMDMVEKAVEAISHGLPCVFHWVQKGQRTGSDREIMIGDWLSLLGLVSENILRGLGTRYPGSMLSSSHPEKAEAIQALIRDARKSVQSSAQDRRTLSMNYVLDMSKYSTGDVNEKFMHLFYYCYKHTSLPKELITLLCASPMLYYERKLLMDKDLQLSLENMDEHFTRGDRELIRCFFPVESGKRVATLSAGWCQGNQNTLMDACQNSFINRLFGLVSGLYSRDISQFEGHTHVYGRDAVERAGYSLNGDPSNFFKPLLQEFSDTFGLEIRLMGHTLVVGEQRMRVSRPYGHNIIRAILESQGVEAPDKYIAPIKKYILKRVEVAVSKVVRRSDFRMVFCTYADDMYAFLARVYVSDDASFASERALLSAGLTAAGLVVNDKKSYISRSSGELIGKSFVLGTLHVHPIRELVATVRGVTGMGHGPEVYKILDAIKNYACHGGIGVLLPLFKDQYQDTLNRIMRLEKTLQESGLDPKALPMAWSGQLLVEASTVAVLGAASEAVRVLEAYQYCPRVVKNILYIKSRGSAGEVAIAQAYNDTLSQFDGMRVLDDYTRFGFLACYQSTETSGIATAYREAVACNIDMSVEGMELNLESHLRDHPTLALMPTKLPKYVKEVHLPMKAFSPTFLNALRPVSLDHVRSLVNQFRCATGRMYRYVPLSTEVGKEVEDLSRLSVKQTKLYIEAKKLGERTVVINGQVINIDRLQRMASHPDDLTTDEVAELKTMVTKPQSQGRSRSDILRYLLELAQAIYRDRKSTFRCDLKSIYRDLAAGDFHPGEVNIRKIIECMYPAALDIYEALNFNDVLMSNDSYINFGLRPEITAMVLPVRRVTGSVTSNTIPMILKHMYDKELLREEMEGGYLVWTDEQRIEDDVQIVLGMLQSALLDETVPVAQRCRVIMDMTSHRSSSRVYMVDKGHTFQSFATRVFSSVLSTPITTVQISAGGLQAVVAQDRDVEAVRVGSLLHKIYKNCPSDFYGQWMNAFQGRLHKVAGDSMNRTQRVIINSIVAARFGGMTDVEARDARSLATVSSRLIEESVTHNYLSLKGFFSFEGSREGRTVTGTLTLKRTDPVYLINVVNTLCSRFTKVGWMSEDRGQARRGLLELEARRPHEDIALYFNEHAPHLCLGTYDATRVGWLVKNFQIRYSVRSIDVVTVANRPFVQVGNDHFVPKYVIQNPSLYDRTKRTLPYDINYELRMSEADLLGRETSNGGFMEFAYCTMDLDASRRRFLELVEALCQIDSSAITLEQLASMEIFPLGNSNLEERTPDLTYESFGIDMNKVHAYVMFGTRRYKNVVGVQAMRQYVFSKHTAEEFRNRNFRQAGRILAQNTKLSDDVSVYERLLPLLEGLNQMTKQRDLSTYTMMADVNRILGGLLDRAIERVSLI